MERMGYKKMHMYVHINIHSMVNHINWNAVERGLYSIKPATLWVLASHSKDKNREKHKTSKNSL